MIRNLGIIAKMRFSNKFCNFQISLIISVNNISVEQYYININISINKNKNTNKNQIKKNYV